MRGVGLMTVMFYILNLDEIVDMDTFQQAPRIPTTGEKKIERKGWNSPCANAPIAILNKPNASEQK
jgi:hypothetical protein